MIRVMTGAAILLAVFGTPSAAQPCNPVIDGTYCASQPGRAATGPSGGTSLTPIQSIAGDLSGPREDTATFGAITFRGDGTRCIGLMRRGNCK
jgi:hypothetical protein